ncbi:hypothetical protein ALP26_102961 [Pseudomonas savastanoi pv. glycinea]|uniref:Uncharacterized protein n=2 Tax=Pseudomonas savastanoi TaxID=29438 RepID=A0A0P9R1Q5_PSESG|nr:hypothetical protein ALO37_102266 [Pseudomonas savastanoi pv. glycinea]KPY13814.1 hypothetical protein ALO55_102368 [Pseudomonas savastanoi pv. phaseolicola]RML44056.1 hypothetical protein ALQ97_102512 [Pseudomonas savastanoi pv. glycinea]RML94457.1 hypothetical protein ALQ87_102299 [Pseudomonas savastanoi pv. glycinea]RMM60626.1 hypothetical protein ALQ74_102474 [Pseudomonas savastanoi pv. glycinea]
MPRTAVYWLIGVQHTQTGTHWITVVPDFLEGCFLKGLEAKLAYRGKAGRTYLPGFMLFRRQVCAVPLLPARALKAARARRNRRLLPGNAEMRKVPDRHQRT